MSHSNPSEQQSSIELSPTSSLAQLLPPANPIITKAIRQVQQKPIIRMEAIPTDNSIHFSALHTSQTYKTNQYPIRIPKKTNSPDDEEISYMQNEYHDSNLVYRRCDNSSCNKRDKVEYISSVFIRKNNQGKIAFPSNIGTLQKDQLQFDSNFPGGNLMLAYNKGNNQYDLILQNDTNTGGCTQWFNFQVKNKRHNFVAKFNIVNLYKSDSLYNKGMKPCVRSSRSDKQGKKVWRRKGFNITYAINGLNYEDNPRKYYKTLTFQYDFTVENDTVQFAHSMPYDLQDLDLMLEAAKGNSKVTIRTIGSTYMGRPIPVVCLNSPQQTSIDKKAIIIMARQHPGETVGSHIAEEMLQEMLRHSDQTEFLLWRYDIYVIPMVNIDGVAVGNYRSNFAGYDLNRCWEKSDAKLHPQAYSVKNFVRKISKKQPVELILDLHGHSRKMGSFFYGNNTGKNPMLFPYIASKCSPHILFESSRFSTERGSKAQTARVVLGKIIKGTGNVYTYQVSFYGHYKQDKSHPFSFTDVHYKQLGKSLVLAMYRTYMETYKQEKNLKESIFLKNMKKQIQQLQQVVILKVKEDSGSDSQAEQLMKDEKQKLKQFYRKDDQQKQDIQQLISEEVAILNKEVDTDNVQSSYKKDPKTISQLLGNGRARQYLEVRNIIKSRFPQLNRSEVIQSEQQLEKELQNKKIHPSSSLRKSHNPKLKIYGQPCQLKSRILSHAQTISISHNELNQKQMKTIEIKRKPMKERQSLLRSYNTVDYKMPKEMLDKQLQSIRSKNKQRNKSLALKEVTPIFNEHFLCDSRNNSPIFRNNEYMGKQIRLPLI